ncbi:unnamed protein product, partial [marine sediment metagenome]
MAACGENRRPGLAAPDPKGGKGLNLGQLMGEVKCTKGEFRP